MEHGKTDVTVKVWGYRAFSIILFIAILRLLKYVKRADFKQAMISFLTVPAYLIIMFICMVYYDEFIVKNEVLDNQKQYIGYNIENTKEAYGINIEQKLIDSYKTITYDEISQNEYLINNIPLVSEDIIKTTVAAHQEEGVYYSYNKPFLNLKNSQLVYFTPREILSNSSMSYNNRTFKYTHGYSMIINSASSIDENGYAKYLLSDFDENKQNEAGIEEPRIYFGTETNSTIVINSNFGKEYDYPLTATTYIENTYDGEAGLNLGFMDRLVMAISHKNLKLAFSSHINKNTKLFQIEIFVKEQKHYYLI